jgi:hypothetical protein
MTDTQEINPVMEETCDVKKVARSGKKQPAKAHPMELTGEEVVAESQPLAGEEPVAVQETENIPETPEEQVPTALSTSEEPAKPEEQPTEQASVPEKPLMEELPTTPDNYCGELQEAIEVGAVGMIGIQDLLEQLKEAVANAEEVVPDKVNKIKQAYYRIINAENDELKRVFIENGGKEEDFKAPEEETAPLLKDLLAEYKQKRAVVTEREEQLKEENYTKKLQLIDRLQALVESQDDFNKRYAEFKEIQAKWKELEPVPQEHVKELWRNYQSQSERFYDLIKINNQFRDYDFKKNLELKTTLCEAIEKLVDEPDIMSAYHQSIKLFQQWREIGPVARDLRESLWARFKEALNAINRNHHAHFEALKANEEENLKAKTALCELVENIDCSALKNIKEWEKKSLEVIEIQKKWRTIGFATKKFNTKIFERFRKACDAFFEKRGKYYKAIKNELENNLRLKRALIEKAEALKTSENWKETSKAMIELQNEWKRIGPVARKYSASIWKQFTSACDHFFAQKNLQYSSVKNEEVINMEKKQQIAQKIEALDKNLPENEALNQLKALVAEWNAVGHVPFKEKDRVYKVFRTALDKQYERLNVAQNDRRIQHFRTAITEMAENQGKGKLRNEREKLMHAYDRMKSELQTYENNVGFLTVSSKGGGSLKKEMEHKIEWLRNEMTLIAKKIDAIDETFK